MIGVAAYVAAMAVTAAVFLAWPGLDPAVSALFWRTGEGFYLADAGWVRLAYTAIPVLEKLVIGLVAGLALLRLVPAARRFHARWAVIAYIAAALALGPGLISNVVLKEHFGRARPHQTVEFGGTKAYSGPFVISDQCPRNCAFVSGHASLAFFMVSFALLAAPGRTRKLAIAAALAFGALVGLARMAQGAHYLSDVIFAGYINAGIAWGLWLVMVRRGWREPAPSTESPAES